MRMDIEGAEYEILQDLIVKGLICRIEKLFIEVHAMIHPSLQALRPLDSILPWLLKPCVDVYVDNNYFTDFATMRDWPKEDGSCLSCPLLYRSWTASACPSTATSGTGKVNCFDAVNTCDVC